MSTRELRFTIQIKGSPETIFDLVADMAELQPLATQFKRVRRDSRRYTVSRATRHNYLDAGPIEKPGSVTEYDPPRHISFHHTVQIRQAPLNTGVDARIRYTFEPGDRGTLVDRKLVLTFHLQGIFNLAMPLVLRGFRKENDRTPAALRQYGERRP